VPENKKRVVLTLVCIDAPAISVFFEPEGAQHQLQQGDSFKVEIVGPDPGEVEIAHSPVGLSVWPWSGAETRAWNRAGDELDL
jgi:hypothetical protein